ncbi:MAG: hypothetical protein AB7O56_13900 [Bauldia sp.]
MRLRQLLLGSAAALFAGGVASTAQAADPQGLVVTTMANYVEQCNNGNGWTKGDWCITLSGAAEATFEFGQEIYYSAPRSGSAPTGGYWDGTNFVVIGEIGPGPFPADSRGTGTNAPGDAWVGGVDNTATLFMMTDPLDYDYGWSFRVVVTRQTEHGPLTITLPIQTGADETPTRASVRVGAWTFDTRGVTWAPSLGPATLNVQVFNPEGRGSIGWTVPNYLPIGNYSMPDIALGICFGTCTGTLASGDFNFRANVNVGQRTLDGNWGDTGDDPDNDFYTIGGDVQANARFGNFGINGQFEFDRVGTVAGGFDFDGPPVPDHPTEPHNEDPLLYEGENFWAYAFTAGIVYGPQTASGLSMDNRIRIGLNGTLGYNYGGYTSYRWDAYDLFYDPGSRYWRIRGEFDIAITDNIVAEFDAAWLDGNAAAGDGVLELDGKLTFSPASATPAEFNIFVAHDRAQNGTDPIQATRAGVGVEVAF